MRSEEILSCLYSSFDKARLDPILLSFKSSELLYDFYHKRIFEMISETLANSQEQAIVHLEEENRKLACMNSELQDKMTQMQASYSALSSENKSTVNAINHIEQKMKDKDEANQHLALTVTQLETQNEMLQNQIEELQIENKNSLDKINELINVLNAKERELVNKNEQINFFKENLQIIKAKQGELTGSLNGMIEQNFELKSELELKNNDLGELVSKIEELKLEFQQKSNEINKEVELLRNENENPTPRLSEDVISFSECRNNLAACLKRTAETHRLIFITQNGRPTSFIGNVEDWDQFVELKELMEDVRVAEEELDRGECISHSELKAQLMAERNAKMQELMS